MPWLGTTQNGSGVSGEGGLFVRKPSPSLTDDPVRTHLPALVRSTGQRPSWARTVGEDESRSYGVGGWSDNIVFSEHFATLSQGITPPPNPIISGAGASYYVGLAPSGTGVTGACIGYVAWYDALHDRWSPLSGPSPTVALANQGRSWTNLPTDPQDESVTHIGLWVSMDGALPRLAVLRDLGTTSTIENVATGALGQAFDEDFDKFPRCRYNVIYHDRQVMAGDDRHKDRLYFSVLQQYERYAGFFLRTRRGEPIVGLLEMRDYLVVLCPRSSYVVQGFTEADIRMDSLEPNVGSISHWSTSHVHQLAVVWSHLGPYVCTGSAMHFVGDDIQNLWKKEYKFHQAAYEDSWAVNDEETNVVKLYVGQVDYVTDLTPWFVSNMNCYWVLDYSGIVPEVGGGYATPDISFDVRFREDHCGAMLGEPDSRRSWLFTGSCDSTIRQENIEPVTVLRNGVSIVLSPGNADDDNDPFQKRIRIVTGVNMPRGPGGDTSDGRTYPAFWLLREHDADESILRLKAGDETCIDYFEGNREYTVPGDAGTTTLQPYPFGGLYSSMPLNPSCVFYCEPMISGRGLCVDLEAIAPMHIRFSGYGFTHIPGETSRRGIVPFLTGG